MAAQNLWYDLKTGDFPATGKAFKIRGSNGGYLMAWGESDMSGSESGYAAGCIYTNISDGGRFVNTGSNTSATWTELTAG